jgi:hypothetical protein
MYTEWYATEFFSQYAPFEDWVTGEMVQSTNVYDAWALLVNLSPNRDAEVTATFYYEDEPPRDFSFRWSPTTWARPTCRLDAIPPSGSGCACAARRPSSSRPRLGIAWPTNV